MQPNRIKSENIFFLNGRGPQKQLMQPKTIENGNNGCGTAPGNLVMYILCNISC